MKRREAAPNHYLAPQGSGRSRHDLLQWTPMSKAPTPEHTPHSNTQDVSSPVGATLIIEQWQETPEGHMRTIEPLTIPIQPIPDRETWTLWFPSQPYPGDTP